MARRHRRTTRVKRRHRFPVPHRRAPALFESQQLAFMVRIADDIQAFESEVLGVSELSARSVLLGATISMQLWDRHGSEARWGDLDVDAVLDHCRDAPAEIRAALHGTLLGLLTWLANNDHLDPLRARAMLARLSLREPPEVTELRRAVAELPGTELARFERRRLERLVRMRARKGSVN
jgi:hypothetical protein